MDWRNAVATDSVCSLPTCGGGLGRGVTANSVFVATPTLSLPTGGRGRCGTCLRNFETRVAE